MIKFYRVQQSNDSAFSRTEGLGALSALPLLHMETSRKGRGAHGNWGGGGVKEKEIEQRWGTGAL